MAWALAGMVVGVVLLVVVVADQDRGGPAVVESTAVVDATAYAAEVSTLCADGIEQAETKGYDESSAAGAEVMDDVAAELAAVPPPEGRADMAQALVDGVADYADLFRARDDDQEAFSQAQNELTVVLEVRARGLGAHCTTGDDDAEYLVHDPSPADPDEVTGAGDAELSDLAAACFAGDLGACDELADSGSGLVFYGVTCGDRLLHEEADDNYSCVETFAGDRPTGDQP